MRPIVVIPTLLVVLALGLTGQYVFSQKGGVSIQTQLEQMSNMSFEDKVALADSLLVDSITPEDGIALLRRIAEERKSRADRQPLLAFFNSVAERKVDPAVGADALLCAAKTLREEFRFGEARPYWEAAFERQPERTEAERAAKANLWYQIAEDDWYEGNWEKGLDEFVRFARDFSDADHRSLQMYAFFEAIPMIVRKIGMELPNSTGVRDMIAAAAVS